MPTAPDLGSPQLNAMFAHAAAARSTGAPKANPVHMDGDFESYRAYELGWHKDLSKEDYLELQGEIEGLEMASAKGEDLPWHEKRQKVISEIMDAGPWTLHPDYGCVLKSDVEAERESQSQRG